MKPLLIEKYADNGQLSHWELINPSTGEIVWSPEAMQGCNKGAGVWFDANKEKPNETGWYLVYDPNAYGRNKIDVYRYSTYNDSWFYDADAYHPSHWRPLPKLPGESLPTNTYNEHLPDALAKVNRVEVIDHRTEAKNYGRAFVMRDEKSKTRLSFQDDGMTLKIFIEDANH